MMKPYAVFKTQEKKNYKNGKCLFQFKIDEVIVLSFYCGRRIFYSFFFLPRLCCEWRSKFAFIFERLFTVNAKIIENAK